jgi:hypothetical protein
MNRAERRLQLWLRAWAPMFALGAAGFYLMPGKVTESVNRQGRLVGMPEAPQQNDNLWVVLASAYMVLVTAFSWRAAENPREHRDLVRLLILGKFVSSTGALGYFIFKRRSYNYLLNFLLDGAIWTTTYKLLADTLES